LAKLTVSLALSSVVTVIHDRADRGFWLIGAIKKVRGAMTETDIRVTQKNDAYQFLKGLEKHLNKTLPSPQQMRKEVRDLVTNARKENNPKHLKHPESAFTNHFLIPRIFDFVSERVGSSNARQCMLSEYVIMRKDYCSASPQRQDRHPFSKGIADGPQAIMRRWKGDPNKQTIQSAPDLALRNPFPFNIVFELKYFDNGGSDKAEKELVTDLYQAFFYRALPYVPRTKRNPSWDYEYACLLAFDASPNGTLQQSWESLPPKVKRGFWEGANVYAMILRTDAG
jgi:hypothetical protein